MKKFIFELAPFEREIKSYKDLKAKITCYGKIIKIFRFNDDEKKPIKYIKVLIVLNMEAFVRLENYSSIHDAIDNVCVIEDFSEKMLPDELWFTEKVS